jgi:hypothetical protein
VLLDLFLTDKTDTSLPARWRVVQHIVHREASGVFHDEGIKLLLEENVFVIDISVYETETRAVARVLEGCTDDLKHRSDTCTTSNHAKLARQDGAVLELALGSFDANGVANFEEGEDAGYITLFIRLIRKDREFGKKTWMGGEYFY